MAIPGSAFPYGNVAPGLLCSFVNIFYGNRNKGKKSKYWPQSRHESPATIIHKQLAHFVHKSAKGVPMWTVVNRQER